MEQGLMNVESLYFVYLWLYLFSSQTFVLRKQKHLGVLLAISLLSYPLLSYFSTSDKKPPLNHDRLYSVTRVPMNVITCGALLCLHVDWVSRDKRLVFGACLVLCLIGESVIVQVRRVLSYICTAL